MCFSLEYLCFTHMHRHRQIHSKALTSVALFAFLRPLTVSLELELNSNTKYIYKELASMPLRTADASQPFVHLYMSVCCLGLGLLNSLYILFFTSSFPNIWSRWLQCSTIMTCLQNHYLKNCSHSQPATINICIERLKEVVLKNWKGMSRKTYV